MMRWVLAISLTLCALGIVALGTADNHRTNVRYLMWKHGWVHGDLSYDLNYFQADSQFNEFLLGKTKPEIEKWFPDLRPLDLASRYQKQYNPTERQGDYLWIGGSCWLLNFENGRLKEFMVMKG